MSNSFTRKTRAAPYFQILSELLHVDLVQEDEVPEADVGVERHGGGLGHSCHSWSRLVTSHWCSGGEWLPGTEAVAGAGCNVICARPGSCSVPGVPRLRARWCSLPGQPVPLSLSPSKWPDCLRSGWAMTQGGDLSLITECSHGWVIQPTCSVQQLVRQPWYHIKSIIHWIVKESEKWFIQIGSKINVWWC